MANKFIHIISIFLLGLVFFSFTPSLVLAVGCGGPIFEKCADKVCTIDEFKKTVNNVISFLVFCIATPVAIFMIIVGGLFLIFSAGNPERIGVGKKILLAAIIGLMLMYMAYGIVKLILTVLGATKYLPSAPS